MMCEQSLSKSTTNSRKRKSEGNSGETNEKPAKQCKTTLDSFFLKQVVTSSVQEDNKQTREHVSLNPDQVDVLKMVVEEEKNVFFTGAAGTGKSLLLRAIISALRKKYSKKPDVVSVTASTGMAALNVGGMTIHAWGAITPGMQNVDKLISYIKTCKPAYKRWKATKVLIIDEVSMVDGHLFDTLAALADQLRKKSDKPFGGIQLVVTGDFFQLPPVTREKQPFFAFESAAWAKCMDNIVTLKQVFRQKDTKFVDLLNQIRLGEISSDAKKTFMGLSRPLISHDGISPTELFPLRTEVDKANAVRLTSLKGHSYIYEARDSGAAAPDKRKKLLDNMVAPGLLELKVDAQVMLIKNVDETLVNGSVGKILGFYTIGVCSGSVAAAVSTKKESRSPVSSSKSKSTTQEKTISVVRNIQVKPDGRTPVAYAPIEKGDGKENVKPEEKAKGKSKAVDNDLYPLVEFCAPQGKEIVLLVRDEFRSEDNEGKLLARRVQIPLVLAWAMSIHKSQGQTLQRVKIDLGKVFEKGQSYVALSRAASLDGLQVLRFDAKKVMAHPKVIEWYKEIDIGERTSQAEISVQASS